MMKRWWHWKSSCNKTIVWMTWWPFQFWIRTLFRIQKMTEHCFYCFLCSAIHFFLVELLYWIGLWCFNAISVVVELAWNWRYFPVSVGREACRFVEGQGGMWDPCFRLVLVGMNILLATQTRTTTSQRLHLSLTNMVLSFWKTCCHSHC